MSEQEQYFLFVNWYRRGVSESIKGDHTEVIIETLIKKVLMKWLNVLGENCTRIPVDFDPLNTSNAFLVVTYVDIQRKRDSIVYKNEIGHIAAFENMAEADQHYHYIANGGFKEKIKKEETFVEAKIHCMPIDKN